MFRACFLLEEPERDRAVHHHADGTIISPAGAGDMAAFHHPQNGKFLSHPGTITLADRLIGPDPEIDIPERAVIGCNGRDTTQNIER